MSNKFLLLNTLKFNRQKMIFIYGLVYRIQNIVEIKLD